MKASCHFILSQWRINKTSIKHFFHYWYLIELTVTEKTNLKTSSRKIVWFYWERHGGWRVLSDPKRQPFKGFLTRHCSNDLSWLDNNMKIKIECCKLHSQPLLLNNSFSTTWIRDWMKLSGWSNIGIEPLIIPILCWVKMHTSYECFVATKFTDMISRFQKSPK